MSREQRLEAEYQALCRRNEAAAAARHSAEMAAAVAVGGPIPHGWVYHAPTRAVPTRAERRAGVVGAIDGWTARRPAVRQGRFGPHVGEEERTNWGEQVTWHESPESRAAATRRVEACVATCRVTTSYREVQELHSSYQVPVSQTAWDGDVAVAMRDADGLSWTVWRSLYTQ